jgi:DNA-directed RNA polymerase specialized sigma24 family protein
MNTNKTTQTPYDFIQRHYRDPGGDDPIKRWLPHPENARAICGALVALGTPYQDLQDAMQDVFVKALKAFRKEGACVPANLEEMKNFCAAIAKNQTKNALRNAARREKLGYVGTCDRDADEYTPLEYGAPVQRDPVDAGKQLEVAAQLFREGRMPEHGVDILEGISAGCTYKRIAGELGITEDLAKWRMREMHRIYRTRMAKLGMLPGMTPLRVVVAQPSAISVLRKAA